MFRKRLVTHGIIVLGVLTAFGLCLRIEHAPACFIGGAISVFGFLWGWFTLRCPFCRRHLPIRGFSMTCCPYCGEEL